ncbi:MAG: hypothetical protein HYY86_03580 [Candidatus Harrisonbacteria bacterium]|nr:hypothetical protein [Candidatus Harrisonbacteria bacterium]
MKRDFTYWLRWLVLLPGTLLAIIFASFLLHWVLYSTLTGFIEPYPELPERILLPFVAAVIFIWAGAYIAPEHKFKTAIILFGILMFSLGGFVFIVFTNSDWVGGQLYFEGGGIGPIMSVLGAIFGLFYPILRKKRKVAISPADRDTLPG